jgi:hypothetical protein
VLRAIVPGGIMGPTAGASLGSTQAAVIAASIFIASMVRPAQQHEAAQ